MTQPPETYCAQHLARLFLSVPPPISLPTHDLCPSEASSSPPPSPSSPTALTLSRRALQAWPLVSARLGPALAPPPLKQTRHPPHAKSPPTKRDHGGRGGGQPPAPRPPALPAFPPLLGEPKGSRAQHTQRAGKIRVRARGTRRGTLTGRSQHGVLCQLLTALRPVSFPTDSPRSGQVISGYRQDKGPVRGGLGATQGLLRPRRAGRRGQGSGLRRHSEHLLPGTALSPAQGHGTPTSHRSRSSTAGEGSQSKACGSCPRAPGADSGRSWE